MSWLWTIVALPIAGSAVLGLAGRQMSRSAATAVGVGSVGASAVVAAALGVTFLVSPPQGGAFVQTLWRWFSAGPLSSAMSLRLDALSLVMVFVVTFVGFLIHLYSAEYMQEDDDLPRFFALMNLFVGSMLLLVLASDLLQLYVGWEGVGLCSYLLIGFWYRKRSNGRAAMKAFIVTRVGDAALFLGIVLLASDLGTLDIAQLMSRAQSVWHVGAPAAVLAASLLVAGAVAKSAQVPLQVWLPDAMAGPAPVSALIHAATMVTAGVYLIARTDALFNLAPAVRLAVGIIGAVTLLISGFSALVQSDIKRVAAYSTMSQLGYMFLALGVGAVSAAVFHLFAHAFFKAAIFLGSGSVIRAMDEDRNLYHMGGLRRSMPLTFVTFTVACASLAALPLVTAGFYSKDLILYRALASVHGSVWLWLAGLVGTLLTTLYASRLVLLVFFGPLRREPRKHPGWRMAVPMSILAFFSVVAGLVQIPGYLGGKAHFTRFLALGTSATRAGALSASASAVVSGTLVVVGIAAAWWVYLGRRGVLDTMNALAWVGVLRRFFAVGWGFDALYSTAIVKPYRALAALDRNDVLSKPYAFLGWVAVIGNRLAVHWQTGRLRTYAFGVVLGAALLLLLAVGR
jgi:NADH-quinone oxidoreductase subunit L